MPRAPRVVVAGIAAGAALGLVAVLVAVLVVVGRDTSGPGHPGPAASAAPSPSVVPSSALRKKGRATRGSAAQPDALIVPAIDLAARVVPIEVTPAGVLDPPADVSEVGWWQRSAEPGARNGQTVLTGHTVHTGGGSMDDLGQLRSGQTVRVRADGEVVRYRVERVVTWTKTRLSEKAVDIFSQDRQRGRLVLITCTDWNGVDYDSNVVAFAAPRRRG